MEITVFDLVKFPGTFFKKHNGIDLFYIPVSEPFPLLFSLVLCPFILPQKQIRRVTGDPLPGKSIADFLNLNVGKASVLQAYHNVCDDQRNLVGKPYGIIGKDLGNGNPPLQDRRKKVFQPFLMNLRIQDFFHDGIRKNIDAFFSGAQIQKFLFLRICQSLKPSAQFSFVKNILQDFLSGADLGKISLQCICHTYTSRQCNRPAFSCPSTAVNNKIKNGKIPPSRSSEAGTRTGPLKDIFIITGCRRPYKQNPSTSFGKKTYLFRSIPLRRNFSSRRRGIFYSAGISLPR